MRLLGAVVHVFDVSRRKRVRFQSVVDSDGDPARLSCVTAEYTAYLSLKRKMTAVMLCHFHPVHPLQRAHTVNPHDHIITRGGYKKGWVSHFKTVKQRTFNFHAILTTTE